MTPSAAPPANGAANQVNSFVTVPAVPAAPQPTGQTNGALIVCTICGSIFALCLIGWLAVGVTFLAPLVAGFIFLCTFGAFNQSKQRDAYMSAYSQQNPSGVYVTGLSAFMGLCDGGTTLFVAKLLTSGQVAGLKLGPQDILEAHISSNSQTVSHTQEYGTITQPQGVYGRAHENLTANTVSNTQQVNIALRITINSMEMPMIQIEFSSMPAAEEWMARIRVLMSRATP